LDGGEAISFCNTPFKGSVKILEEELYLGTVSKIVFGIPP